MEKISFLFTKIIQTFINPLSSSGRAHTPDILPLYLGVWTLLGELKRLIICCPDVLCERRCFVFPFISTFLLYKSRPIVACLSDINLI